SGLQERRLDDGARYDPVADRWRPITTRGAPSFLLGARAAWTGNELIVWGGELTSPDQRSRPTGGRYDPAADTWRPMSPEGAPPARFDPALVWTGKELIVWGGAADGGDHLSPLQDGARYDPVADRWRPLTAQDAPGPRYRPAGLWTGQELIVWSGAT